MGKQWYNLLDIAMTFLPRAGKNQDTVMDGDTIVGSPSPSVEKNGEGCGRRGKRKIDHV